MIRLAWPDVGPEEAAAAAEVLEGGQLTMGQKVVELEGELARACGVEHAVAVSSGTAALHLAVLALGIGEGDEVLVPAYTFPATANVVALAGARPVLVDVDPKTMNLDPGRVYDAVTPRTRAVLAVHLFGRPLDWDELQNAVPPDVHLVEDAAGALGARWRGMPCGGLGETGMPLLPPAQDRLDRRGRGRDDERRRPRGLDSPAPSSRDLHRRRLRHRRARVQLPPLGRALRHRPRPDAPPGGALEARHRLAKAYAERLADVVETPAPEKGDRHGWQAYVVQLDRRDQALEALREAGIEAQIGTYAVHHLTAYSDQGPFPGADSCYERALALPFHSRLSEPDLDRVAGVLDNVVSE